MRRRAPDPAFRVGESMRFNKVLVHSALWNTIESFGNELLIMHSQGPDWITAATRSVDLDNLVSVYILLRNFRIHIHFTGEFVARNPFSEFFTASVE